MSLCSCRNYFSRTISSSTSLFPWRKSSRVTVPLHTTQHTWIAATRTNLGGTTQIIRTLVRFRSKKQGNRRKMQKAKPLPTAFMEPIHILGGGSIGMLVASSIRTAFPSYPVTLLLRSHHQKHLEMVGSKFRATISVQSPIDLAVPKEEQEEKDEPTQQHQQSSTTSTKVRNRVRMVTVPVELINTNTNNNDKEDPPQKATKKMRPIQNILLATKAPDASDALQSILSRLDPNKTARIIILCNGALAVRDAIEQVLEQDTLRLVHAHKFKIILASTTHGAYQEKDDNDDHDDDDDQLKMYHLVHAGIGQTFVENEPVLTKMLDRSGLVAKSISTSEVSKLLWYKLATNCTINPITALLQCENGYLQKYMIPPPSSETEDKDDEYYRTLIQKVLEEISQIGIAETGYKNALQTDKLQTFVQQVIQDTAQNKSSMLQDVLKKQPTEIDYLNGYVVKLGEKHNIDTPANQLLVDRIQQLTGKQIK